MRLAIVLLAVVLPLLSAAAEAPIVDCTMETLDQELNKITGSFGDPKNFPYPTDDAKLTRFCKDFKTATKYAKAHADKCSPTASKSILSVFAFSINQRYKRYCSKNRKGREEMIRIGRCTNTKPVTDLIQKCYGRFLRKLSTATTIKNEKNRIPHMCCGAFELQNCFVDNVAAVEDEMCSEETKRDTIALFESVAVNMLNLACDESLQSPEKCARIAAEAKPPRKTLQYKSPFPSVLGIFESLADS